MNYSKYRFNLDMQSYISQISLPVRQHDTGIVLRINLTDGGVPYVINDGCRAVFYARKSDGNPLMNDCIIEKNTTICYELTQQTTSCSGVVDCEVRLYGKDGNLITTPRFILVIDSRVVHDEDFPLSESEQTVLDNIILSEQKRLQNEVEREKTYEELIATMRESHETMLDTVETASNVASTLREKLDTGDYDGITPHVGENGNWWFDDEDSGVLARGVTPHIGTNGNWWIDEVDTGVLANGLVIPLRPGEGENSVVQQSDVANTATSKGASAFGGHSRANAEYSFVENYGGKALGKKSHVEGESSLTGGSATAGHAEGDATQEMAPAGHTEGKETQITWQGTAGHAQNYKTKVTAPYASAAGNNTIASARSQFVVGEFNKENPDALLQVGNGKSDTARSNAFEVLKDGTLLGDSVLQVAIGVVQAVSGLSAELNFDFIPRLIFYKTSAATTSSPTVWLNSSDSRTFKISGSGTTPTTYYYLAIGNQKSLETKTTTLIIKNSKGEILVQKTTDVENPYVSISESSHYNSSTLSDGTPTSWYTYEATIKFNGTTVKSSNRTTTDNRYSLSIANDGNGTSEGDIRKNETKVLAAGQTHVYYLVDARGEE